ncbi:sirohydrochlorin chelatase [Gordonia phthalatica]|uniref:Cobalamin biosynthesis protein CbiX n=1 Tax=Gordonia phthalatica TaxID=1136941 RepID=A0A0N9N4K8_9ACTN|nr:CbiX/SirB N-terminal domain-containing protein [Gordonia phthalatica]ALG85354.1 cobalamin biosynthesis protein CbiX [Gordonia phthalatica]
MSTLLLVAHGSRDPRFDITARRVVDAVRVALPGVRVELAYLDLTAPLVADVLADLTGEVVAVPLLFGDGFHSKVDLPALIADAAAANPSLRVRQTPVVGRYSPVPALADRLVESGLSPRDGVLMTAVGSSDPGSDASVIERGHELSGVIGLPVHTLFATRFGRDGAAVRAAVRSLAAAGAERIAVSPLFLSAGLLSDRVERYLDAMNVPMIVAGPVAEHACLIGAVTRLYAAAAVDSVHTVV